MILPTLNNNNNIEKICNRLNIQVVSKSNQTLKNFVKNNPEINNSEKQNIIYEIPCSGCSKSYIGESSDFNRRMYQHKYSQRNFDQNNALVKHSLDTNHPIDINKAIIVHKENDIQKRKLIESLIIKNTDNINTQQTNYSLDQFSIDILTQHTKIIKGILNRLHNFSPGNIS